MDDPSRKAADDALMERVAAQMEQLRDSDPQAWADYLQGGPAWEGRGADDRVDGG